MLVWPTDGSDALAACDRALARPWLAWQVCPGTCNLRLCALVGCQGAGERGPQVLRAHSVAAGVAHACVRVQQRRGGAGLA